MHTKRRPNNMNGGGGNNGGQHRHHSNNRPRRFNANGRPQNGGGDDAASVARTRRNSIQSREKYQMMARDALAMGDRVLAENYLQHADHYHRILLSLPPEEAPRPQYLTPQHEQRANGNGEHPQADGNRQDSSHAGSDGSATPAHDLPSFITQPVHPGNPEE